MNTLGERISAALHARNLKQADLAKRCGLSTAIVSQICTGRTKDPMFEKVVLIARELNVSLDYLAGKTAAMGQFVEICEVAEIEGLSLDERELVELFRSMTQQCQDAVLVILREMSQS